MPPASSSGQWASGFDASAAACYEPARVACAGTTRSANTTAPQTHDLVMTALPFLGIPNRTGRAVPALESMSLTVQPPAAWLSLGQYGSTGWAPHGRPLARPATRDLSASSIRLQGHWLERRHSWSC